MPTVAYSEAGDLLTGDLRLTGVSVQNYVDAAAEEIDSYIGAIYETPLDLQALSRPAALFIKRIANNLASGRLIMSVAVGAEADRRHAYGASLVNEALRDLRQITERAMLLDGATLLPGASGSPGGPETINQDAVSGVDSFYENFMSPHLPLMPTRQWTPGRGSA